MTQKQRDFTHPEASPTSGFIPPVETRWKPGVSGNPAGRPRGSRKVVLLARRHTLKAMRALVEALDAEIVIPFGKDGETITKPDHATRTRAAIAIHDRGYGKPMAAETLDKWLNADDEIVSRADGLTEEQSARIYQILKEGKNA